MILSKRPRRLRKSEAVRNLVAQTQLSAAQLVYPVFICAGTKVIQPIQSLPEQDRVSVDVLCDRISHWKSLGIKHYALFTQIAEDLKSPEGSEALNESGLLATAIKTIKRLHPEINLITDVALDPFSSDGHDGLVKDGKIVNDESVEILCKMAVAQARWGADSVAPSDMMDGRIGAIRKALDQNGFTETSIIAYSAKYASCFYGPFRDALNSAPKHGDKKTYQMDFRNSDEALREVKLDIEEGADIVMIKPGLSYLDIVAKVKAHFDVPVAAYNVSGEYAMVKAASALGVLDEDKAVMEILTSFRRAGADMIFTYHAPKAAQLLAKGWSF